METLAQPAHKSGASGCYLSVGNAFLPRQDPWGPSQQLAEVSLVPSRCPSCKLWILVLPFQELCKNELCAQAAQLTSQDPY